MGGPNVSKATSWVLSGGGTGRACALGPNGLAFLQGHLLWGLASPLTAPPTPSHSAAQASSTATNGRRLTRSSHPPLSARPDTCPPPLAAEPAATTPSRAREKLTDQRHPRNQASIFSTVKILPPLSDPISGHTSWRGDGHQQGDKALPWERQAGRSWAPHSSQGSVSLAHSSRWSPGPGTGQPCSRSPRHACG